MRNVPPARAWWIAGGFFVLWLLVMLAGADTPPPFGFLWIVVGLVAGAGEARRLRDVADADLDDLVASEYLNLLIDACTTGDAAVQRGARELLARDFAVPTTADLDEAAAAISRSLQAVGGGDDGGPPLDRRRLAELCGAIAATVVTPADRDGAAQR